MPDISIRPATLADIPAITDIYAREVHGGTATFELDAPDIAEMTQRFSSLTDNGFPYLVALNDEDIVGYAYAGPYRVRPAYRFTVENSIYLRDDHQRRGVGSTLLTELIAHAAGAGFRQMIAVIGDSSNHGSIKLHSRLGFAMIGTLPNVGFKFGRWLDSVLMQRPLGEGSNTTPRG